MPAPGAASVGALAGGVSATVNPAAPASAGATQIAIISVTVNSETVTAVPAGWTLRASLSMTTPNSNVPDRGNTQFVWVYSQDVPDTAAASWTKSGTRRFAAVRISWPDVLAAPTFGSPTQSNDTTTHSTPSITPPANTDVKVIGIAAIDQGPTPVTLTPPGSPWSTVSNTTTPAAASESQTIAVVEQTIAATASPSAVSASFTTSAAEEAFLLSLVLPGTSTGGGDPAALTRGFLSILAGA